jgi:biopolymer transport protein ExbD
LMGDGTLRVNGEPVEADALAEAVKTEIGGRGDMAVTILAEQGSKTQALVAAVEAARISGANGVGTARVEKIKP